jgi:hypothetical protein
MMKIGSVITLKGLSRHGKNRIREKGSQWKVREVREKVSFNTPAPGPFLLLDGLGPVRDARWVSLRSDPNFEIVEAND